MLGWPTDPKLVIRPGKSIGTIEIGDTKEDVKNKLGSPEAKNSGRSAASRSWQMTPRRYGATAKRCPKRAANNIHQRQGP